MIHNHNDKGNSWMSWAMILCCAAPILFIVFGTGVKIPGISEWIAIGMVAVFVIVHFVMMKRHRKHSDEASEEKDERSTTDKLHRDYDCRK